MEKNRLRLLALTFRASGIWDTIAGLMYLFVIGTGRVIEIPPAHSFYCVFLASFFFCFAYLQFYSSVNIELYIFNVGCLIVGRVAYVIQLYFYMLFFDGFPSTFWFTGIIDFSFVVLYLILSRYCGFGLRDLFLPRKRCNCTD